jgi:nucleotide-binding universal stress UspA family protein
MKRVLIPVDGSQASLEAVRIVAKEGPDEIERIDLVNVQPLLNRHIAGWIGKQRRDAWRAERAQRAFAQAVQIAALSGIDVRTHLATGPVAAAIARAARELHANEIVLCSSRRNPIDRMLANSVSSRLLQVATVPVRIIPGAEPPFVERLAVPAGLGLIALFVLAD